MPHPRLIPTSTRHALTILVSVLTPLVGNPAGSSAQTTFTRVLLGGEPLVGSPSPWFLATQASISPSGEYFAATGQIFTGSTAVAAGNATVGFHLVASSNPSITSVPGAPAIATFSSFPDVFVDDEGRVLVRAVLNGAIGPGLWIDINGVLSKIVRTGDPVPASEGLGADVVFATVADTASGVTFSGGRAAFLATLSGSSVTTSNDRSIWLFDAADSSLRMVAREGARWQAFGQPLIDVTGRAAFYGDLLGEPSGSDGMLVAGPFDSLDPFAREGDPAPGAGVNYLANDFPQCATYVLDGLTLNDRGEVAFLSTLVSPGGTQQGLWRRGPGLSAPVFKIARQGDPVAGFGSPSPLMGEPLTPRLGGGGAGAAANGAIAWRTSLTGGSVSSTNDGVVFRFLGAGSPTTPEVIVREGDAAPGESPGAAFSGVPTSFAINREGEMFIRATIAGGSLPAAATSYFANHPGSPGGTFKIVRAGDSASFNGVPGVTTATASNPAVSTLLCNSPHSGRPSAISDRGGLGGGGLVAFTMTIVPPGGGSITGVFTTSLAPDPVGACCRGSTCVSVPQSQCGPTPAAGRFTGANVACNVFPNTIAPCCMADFNGSGGAGGGNITVQDIFDFLAAYFAGDLRADINGSGGLSVQDIFDFLAAYFSGCA